MNIAVIGTGYVGLLEKLILTDKLLLINENFSHIASL